MTAYSTGMRREEVCQLKVEDINSKRMLIRIRQGKGRRDCDVPLNPKVLETLREPITAKMLWEACREAAQRA
jgi:integrase/recombinase XerD